MLYELSQAILGKNSYCAAVTHTAPVIRSATRAPIPIAVPAAQTWFSGSVMPLPMPTVRRLMGILAGTRLPATTAVASAGM
jgi:hypothetical protein